MAYVDPATVTSPRKVVRSVDVLYNTKKDGWSVARLNWNGSSVLGIRWNGGKNSGLGVPQSFAKPTWFVVPDELEEVIRDRVEEILAAKEGGILDGYRAMASDRERETEAEVWSEALIGDASAEG
jgi:hypothetical protein